MPLLVACDSMGTSVWAEGGRSCNLGGPIALVHTLKNPISLACCAVFVANLPSSWGFIGFVLGGEVYIRDVRCKIYLLCFRNPHRVSRGSLVGDGWVRY